tara:strand:+ start:62 stop:2689 length:2628 start_codon:yes stop_codon:yes gene_type:complete
MQVRETLSSWLRKAVPEDFFIFNNTHNRPLEPAVGFHPDVKFSGSWRPYQERVLKELDHHLEDGCVHVVAAPGAGKTVLGLEIVQRLGEYALVLTPRTAIRDQWIKAFSNLFITDEVLLDELTSIDVNDVKPLTVLTYQSLGGLRDKEDGEQFSSKVLPNLIKNLQRVGVKTLVLDESHHLTETWGLAVKRVAENIDGLNTVSLTATPPFDYDKSKWDQFVDICGEIDTEISIPELVERQNLCPHQDYVYFNSPSEQSCLEIEKFRLEVKKFSCELKSHDQFFNVLKNNFSKLHKGEIDAGKIEYILALIQYAKENDIDVPKKISKKYGFSSNENSNSEIQSLEIILQEAFLERSEFFDNARGLKEEVLNQLNSIGAMDDGVPALMYPRFIEDALVWSGNKLESITAISELESKSLGQSLRLVVLTDWIGDDALDDAVLPDEWETIGVYPIFHSVEKALEVHGLSVGAVSGRLVILPKSVVELLRDGSLPGNAEFVAVDLSSRELPSLSEKYQIVTPRNDTAKALIIRQVTELFNQGYLNALIGTAGLLGEGWDSPAVNSLILASYVGSFMLSNQMRGRALRVNPSSPDKVSNIWHLATVDSTFEDGGKDLEKLDRRFGSFVGLEPDKVLIESGFSRLNLPVRDIGKDDIIEINRKTIECARERKIVREKWENALESSKQKELVDIVELEQLSKRFKVLNGINANTKIHRKTGLLLKNIYRGIQYDFTESFLVSVIEATKSALSVAGFILEDDAKIKVKPQSKENGTIALLGGWRQERTFLLRSLKEVFLPNQDTRYLIRCKFSGVTLGYFGVPSKLGVRNEFAEMFKEEWQKNICSCELIYTRSVEGERHLVKASASTLQKAPTELVRVKSRWI